MQRTIILMSGVAMAGCVGLSAPRPHVAETFGLLTGELWTGELAYLDYSSDKMTTIPVELTVRRISDGQFAFAYRYPEEPNANSDTRIRISNDGMQIDGEPISEMVTLEDGTTLITTRSDGTDNGKPAHFLNKYRVSGKAFSVQKEVQYSGTSEYFLRNEYRFTRD